MRFGVIVFPGTWSDVDCFHVISQVLKQPVEYVWHKETDLSRFDFRMVIILELER